MSYDTFRHPNLKPDQVASWVISSLSYSDEIDLPCPLAYSAKATDTEVVIGINGTRNICPSQAVYMASGQWHTFHKNRDHYHASCCLARSCIVGPFSTLNYAYAGTNLDSWIAECATIGHVVSLDKRSGMFYGTETIENLTSSYVSYVGHRWSGAQAVIENFKNWLRLRNKHMRCDRLSSNINDIVSHLDLKSDLEDLEAGVGFEQPINVSTALYRRALHAGAEVLKEPVPKLFKHLDHKDAMQAAFMSLTAMAKNALIEGDTVDAGRHAAESLIVLERLRSVSPQTNVVNGIIMDLGM